MVGWKGRSGVKSKETDVMCCVKDVRYTYSGRINLTYKWISDNHECLLDVGCASGYGSKKYAEKVKSVIGIDNDVKLIANASMLYSDINFVVADLAKIPFKDNSFDAVAATDVIEHLPDDKATLDEIYRVLKKEGIVIISVPHKGLFGFLDQDNIIRVVFRYCPFVFNLLKLFRKEIEGKLPNRHRKLNVHKHYSLPGMDNLLKKSLFGKGYKIEHIFRSGLFLGILLFNIHTLLKILVGRHRAYLLIRPFFFLAELDYYIPFGALSFNMIIRVRKI